VNQETLANPARGIITRLAAVALLSLMFALMKLADDAGVTLVEAIFWRQAAAVPLMLLIAVRLPGGLRSLRTERPGGHALRMALGLTGMALNFGGMILLPLAEATVIGFSIPLFATFLAALLLREPTGPWRWAALLFGLVGVLIVIQPGPALWQSPGALVALAGALVTALVTIQLRTLGRTEAATTIVFWFTLGSLVPLGLLLPWFASAHDGHAWLLIGGVALCGALAQWALTEALRRAPVAVILPMDYTSLLWASLLGWQLFDQLPSPATAIGAPLIIASGLIILWREQHRRLPPTPLKTPLS
jgi:drug/metabolite transporter (DMT)-like permease